ncbi:MAG: TMEM43 family protein [Candidatus Margulisiibacteriota bacterium]
MADQFAEVTSKNWGRNLLDSFVGVGLGIILFLASFWVLWTNEGSVDLSKVVKTSLPVAAVKVDPANNGKFVSLTGTLTTTEKVGDPGYLSAGYYLQLARKVEMFAWVENKSSKTEDKLGGGSETKTTYAYEKKWTASPGDSTRFKYPEGHQNPPLTLNSDKLTVRSARIGAYNLDPGEMKLPDGKELRLLPEMLLRGYLLGNTQFIGQGSTADPRIGDIRLSYTIIPSNINVTVFGQIEGASLVPYVYDGERTIFRAIAGSREQAMAKMKGEHKAALWAVRLIGFLMMWFGLFLFFGPLNTLLKVVPFLGTAGRFVSGLATFPAALIL